MFLRCLDVCICLGECVSVCMGVCMFRCMYVCMDVCMYIYILFVCKCDQGKGSHVCTFLSCVSMRVEKFAYFSQSMCLGFIHCFENVLKCDEWRGSYVSVSVHNFYLVYL